ncbi:MAG: oligosaccharide flippase family protein [Rikenellaceae bacterium]|nr:oligosaccharide flippase family protein [Rikenellaceae bacterium]
MGRSGKRSSYRQIFKATTIFGGVQVFSVVINLLRAKVIALFLGPEGMGIFYLFQNPLTIISQITGLGIGSSGIRDVAKTDSAQDTHLLSITFDTIKKWTRLGGLAGTLLTFILAKHLSMWSFGSEEYAWAFVWLSGTVFFVTVSNGYDAMLKGTRRLKSIAKAGIISSSAGLIASIPLYYYLGVTGIVYGTIATVLALFAANWYYSSKIPSERVEQSAGEVFDRGKKMASLGIMMVLASIMETLAMYIVNMYIRSNGDTADVGLFQAAIQITNISVGLVYTAMAGDYYPRLSAVCGVRSKVNELVNQQAEIAAIITAPILIGMMLFSPFLIRILLSPEFLPVIRFVNWILFASLLRSLYWTIHWVMLAHGHTRMFFYMCLIPNALTVALYIPLYNYGGINALGAGYLAQNLITTLILYYALRRKYLLIIRRGYFNIFFTGLAAGTIVLLSLSLLNKYYGLASGIVILILLLWYSFRELNRRVGVVNFISKLRRHE